MSTPAVIISVIKSKSLKGDQAMLPHRVVKDNFNNDDYVEDVVVDVKRTFTKADDAKPMYGIIYHHWDGYPNTLGRHLKKHYKKQENVENLIAFGNMSTIVGGEKPYIKPHFINGSKDDWYTSKPLFSTSIEELLDEYYHQFAYLFDGEKWFKVSRKNGVIKYSKIY